MENNVFPTRAGSYHLNEKQASVETNTKGKKATAPSFGFAELTRSCTWRHSNHSSASVEGVEGECALVSLLCLYSGVYQQRGSCCEQPRGKPALPNRGLASDGESGVRTASAGSALGREVQLGPASRKKGSLFFAFSFWCQGKGPAAGPAPRYRRSRLLASPIVFSSGGRGFQLPPVMGLCPARRKSPPKEQPSCILIDGKDLQIRLAWPTALLFLSPISLIQ